MLEPGQDHISLQQVCGCMVCVACHPSHKGPGAYEQQFDRTIAGVSLLHTWIAPKDYKEEFSRRLH